jgi:nitrilase
MPRVAAIQMVSSADVDENIAAAGRLIAAAAADGARLIGLPEFWAIISDDDRAKLAIREAPGRGPIQEFLAGAAREHGVWLIGGTIPIQSDEEDRVFNTCLLFNDRGEPVVRYDKLHLFDVYVGGGEQERYNESATLRPGNEVVAADTPFGRLGLTVCYDVRFPELYRRLSADGATLFSVPSAFTERTGREHWEVLLRARAVENLAYVIAPAQGGQHGRRRTFGHSMVVDPWGKVLACVDSGPGVACADLDFERLHELRRTFPALQHRRL